MLATQGNRLSLPKLPCRPCCRPLQGRVDCPNEAKLRLKATKLVLQLVLHTDAELSKDSYLDGGHVEGTIAEDALAYV